MAIPDYDSLPLQVPPLDPLFLSEDVSFDLDDMEDLLKDIDYFSDHGMDFDFGLLNDHVNNSGNNCCDDAGKGSSECSNAQQLGVGRDNPKLVDDSENRETLELDHDDMCRIWNVNGTAIEGLELGDNVAKFVENLDEYLCSELDDADGVRVTNAGEVGAEVAGNNCVSPGLDTKDVVFCNGVNSGEGSSSLDRNDRHTAEWGGPASSHGSGNCDPALEAVNCLSPGNESGNSATILEDEMAKSCLPKRKKWSGDGNGEVKRCKLRRSPVSVVENSGSSENEVDEKKMARLMRNRESAQLSRQRKKHYVEELEDKVRMMTSMLNELNSKMSFIMAENVTLRQQLAAGSMSASLPGMYPTMPMGYPWAPYVMRPHGSQVPLVPIPRLKRKQPTSSSKDKKIESKKTEGKTKKVASLSFLGILFFIILLGGLFPIVHNKYGENGEKLYRGYAEKVNGPQQDRILAVDGHLNGSDNGRVKGSSGQIFDFGKIESDERRYAGKKPETSQREGSQLSKNVSKPLVASLYVPRNDKLVKIDGNLIIHSVLAGQKAMASQIALAIPTNLAPAVYSEAGRNRVRQSQLYGSPSESQRALPAGPSNDYGKSALSDGKLQQWFREGLAGPLLSSGMCTEVFQFDTSPSSVPGAIVAASSVKTNSSNHRQNSTRPYNVRNRRTLQDLPVKIDRSALNITEEHAGRDSPKENLQGNKTSPPMVVSVLVDPREAGDDLDGVVGPKPISRIFVVVLLDSVKYVTYSCMLPLKGSSHQRVTT